MTDEQFLISMYIPTLFYVFLIFGFIIWSMNMRIADLRKNQDYRLDSMKESCDWRIDFAKQTAASRIESLERKAAWIEQMAGARIDSVKRATDERIEALEGALKRIEGERPA